MDEFLTIYSDWVNIFSRFYDRLMPFMLFVLCYLLFKKSPSKKAYFHLGVVIFLVVSKHWVSIISLKTKANELHLDFIASSTILTHLILSLITALSCVLILALLHRNNGAGYDILLKKEIWGIWAKENNTSDYFDAQERKLRTQGAKDNEQ